MSRIRIHELAKELNMKSKDLMKEMSTMDIEFKKHASASIASEEAAKVKNKLKGEASPKKQEKSTPKTKAKESDTARKPSQKSSSKPSHKQKKKQKHKREDKKRVDKKKQDKAPKAKEEVKKEKTDKKAKRETDQEAADDIRIVELPDLMTVQEFSDIIEIPGNEVVKYFFDEGEMFTITSTLDYETAVEAAAHFDVLVEEEKEVDVLQEAFGDVEDEENTEPRPPVVVVMGHVDHGKTSLLDAIRESKVRVTSGEAGGITQHIGAYTVSVGDKPITFLDTPGHEAFTAMRMRGARVTDVAILVVAADDGVMPQTIEAINHAKAAELDIIVAINKMDKPSANPDMVKQELLEHDLVTEDWGGDTICVPVSAHSGEGIDDLLEMILLVSTMQENKANSKLPGRGAVVEASLDKGKGAVATVLVQNGTLTIGDAVVAGGAYGRVRALTDDRGKAIRQAGPSIPVELLGLNSVPAAGDMFYVAENDRQARNLAGDIEAQDRVEIMKAMPTKVSLDDLFDQIKAGEMKDLNLIVKADVQGSVEAVRESLERLSNEEVRVRVIHGGVGAVAESDVMLASASNAIIIGFNVRPEASAKAVAETEQVDIRLYRVIYNAIEDIEMAMKGMLDPIFEEQVIGHAEVRQIFKSSGTTIAGSYVTDGKIARNGQVRLMRDNVVIYEGDLDALKRFQDDVREVKSGYECGISLERFNDIKEGDIIEAFEMVEIER